jgi:hypothetical protein
VHFSKEVLDQCKWNGNTLQALNMNMKKSILLCYSSQCPVHFSKEVLDRCKWNVNTLQALLRNFLLLNNFATWSLVLQRFLLRCVLFSFGTRFYITLLISLPKDISEIIWNPVPKKKKKQRGVRTSAVEEIRLQTYLLLFLWTTRFLGRKGGRSTWKQVLW